MIQWKDDKTLFPLMRKHLFVALVGDILDTHGYVNQFLPVEIKPIQDHMVLIGRAMPVLEADYSTLLQGASCGDTPCGDTPCGDTPCGDTLCEDIQNSRGSNFLSQKDFGFMFEALDDLKESEIYICSGASPEYALWGGLMSTRALVCKAAGAVVNGYHRDSNEIERLSFPVFSMGSYAQDQRPRGKVIDWRIPIKFGNTYVKPGDLIFGDRDGILIVPQTIEREVLQGAFEKAIKENKVLQALKEGMSTVDAYKKFGVM